MKHDETPWFLMWCSAVLFAFGMIWAWLISIGAAQAVTILDMPVCSALLIGAGVLGTVLGQLAMVWAWRRYLCAMEDDISLVGLLTARNGKAPDDAPSCESATKPTEVRR